MAENLKLPQNLDVATPQPALTPRELPLNLIALIVSHMEDLSDIARLTCTCRLLYYMTLPKLWERVTLRSYDEIRYNDGRPEGFGSGSPFAMGLNALVTGNVASYVRSITFAGEWKELDLDDYSRGRVPDNAMMLNISIRAALDRMTSLEEFHWKLNPKLSQTVYQGLAQRPNLRSLTLRFPSKRMPRPTRLIPPMPQLRKFIAYDLDPLAYPDDISLLLLNSTKIEDLTLHWNPRIRRDAEQSVNLASYFGKLAQAKRSLKLKHGAFYNMFAPATGTELDEVLDFESAISMTVINEKGIGNQNTVFVDDTWRVKGHRPTHAPLKTRIYRGDVLDKPHAKLISMCAGMQEIYFINTSRLVPKSPPSTNGTPSTPTSATDPSTPKGGRFISPYDIVAVAPDYLAAIQGGSNGASMTRILLSDQWLLEPSTVRTLCTNCPNLVELGVALSTPDPEATRVFMPAAPRLQVLRQLFKPGSDKYDKLESTEPEMLEILVAYEFWRPEYRRLRWLGMGSFAVFKLGGIGKHPDGKGQLLRHNEMKTLEEVQHLRIFRFDSTEILSMD